jgi:hypothetical protein
VPQASIQRVRDLDRPSNNTPCRDRWVYQAFC